MARVGAAPAWALPTRVAEAAAPGQLGPRLLCPPLREDALPLRELWGLWVAMPAGGAGRRAVEWELVENVLCVRSVPREFIVVAAPRRAHGAGAGRGRLTDTADKFILCPEPASGSCRAVLILI